MSRLLHDCLAAQAAATPQAIALLQDTRSIEYAALAARVAAIGGALAQQGLGAGALVALHLERSIEQVAAMLGILQCGASVLPLPPSWPLERRRQVLAFARAAAVIDGEGSALDPSLHPRILREERLDGPAHTPARIDPAQAAFVLSTSGSTGAPKLIVRSNASFFHRLEWTWRTHPFEPGERCCQKSHMTTTHAVYELFEPLARGVPTRIVADNEVRNLEQFWDTVRTGRITRLLLVPSMLQATLEMPGFVPPPLRVLVLMGEYLHPRLAARALATFDAGTALYSIYGSTEASSTLVCDLRASYREGEELPLGRPIADSVQAFVLDAARNPVAPGASGRLHIAGSALFSGYLHQGEQTAATLIALPGVAGPVYDTHDEVRVAADGALQFVGRTDHAVKIRGFRVDLQEVEAALRDHPEIAHAAVLCEREALLGFYAPRSVEPESVYRLLRARLPAYMVPGELHALDRMPLTPSGKIDRVVLLAERRSHAPAQGDITDPREQRIAQVWREVLQHGSFGREHSFFEVGGSSLSAFAVVQGLRDAFALDRDRLPGQVLYECPSIAALAARIGELQAGGTAAMRAENPLVTLRSASDPSLAPLFVIASAGGALGSYERLVKLLAVRRAVLGVRDPWLWGARDATRGFGHWVDGYVAAIRAHQPQGPYHLCAYSSAGAFGYEIARRLHAAGEPVALLALIDPVGMDLLSKRRFGYWAMEARFRRPVVRAAVRLAGRMRALLPRGGGRDNDDAPALTAQELEALLARVRANDAHVRGVAQLMELSSGRAFGLSTDEIAQAAPGTLLESFIARARRIAPDADPELIERMVLQYALQVRAQNGYRVRDFPGAVTLFEPAGPAAGLVAAQLCAHVARLDARILPLAWPAEREHPLDALFPRRMRTHYLCMRDEGFVAALARAMTELLDGPP